MVLGRATAPADKWILVCRISVSSSELPNELPLHLRPDATFRLMGPECLQHVVGKCAVPLEGLRECLT